MGAIYFALIALIRYVVVAIAESRKLQCTREVRALYEGHFFS